MIYPSIYPWQTKQWQLVQHLLQSKRLPHALLLTGMSGMGKLAFAEQLARVLVCQQKLDHYCDACHDCRLAVAQHHPNVLRVFPEKEGQAIKVEAIRAVSEFVQQSALQGREKIVIIHPANQMNVNAANALLKTLEEPTSHTSIILINDQSRPLPATILSRCQRILFSNPTIAQAHEWLQSQLTALKIKTDIDLELLLQLNKGAPLAALDFLQQEKFVVRRDVFQALYELRQSTTDLLQLAAKLQDYAVLACIDFALSWVMDLLRLQLHADISGIINKDYLQQLQLLQTQKTIKKNMDFLQHLISIRQTLSLSVSLNKQLLLENMLWQWRG